MSWAKHYWNWEAAELCICPADVSRSILYKFNKDILHVPGLLMVSYIKYLRPYNVS